MQVVHATFYPGEGKEAVQLLDTLGVDIEDYKLISSSTGDLLIINLLYGDTDILLDNLGSNFDFIEDEERSLIIFTPDTVIPRDKAKQERFSFHAARESLLTFAQVNSRIDSDYLLLVIASAIIVSLGLILNNTAIVVGGMVIAPVLGPILAVTIGITLGKAGLIRQGVSAEIIAVVLAVFIGFIFAMIIPGVEITPVLENRIFPTLADLIIATAAGAAAAYSIIRGRLSTALIGVMVAASLLPVMCTIGIGISLGFPHMIYGAALLLGGNFTGLLLANLAVFYFEGLRPQIWYQFQAQKLIKKSIVFIIIAALLLGIPLGIMTIYQFYLEKPAEIIKSVIQNILVDQWGYRLIDIEINGNLIQVILYGEKMVKEEILLNVKHQIEARLNEEYNINFKIIPLREVNV